MTEPLPFDEHPEQAAPRRPLGKPRLLEPERDQLELRSMDLDSLIGADHPARLFWAYCEQLDLSELEGAIKAREGRPGHPAIAPCLLLALWLYATSEGVGSARALARLCESHDGYRWLMGGVSVNHHTLSDFRVGHGAVLDRLLMENVAVLMDCGLIDFDRLSQDGVRIRAGAGAASYRRRATLEAHLTQAREVVEQLKSEVDDDPAASTRRIVAARKRAARERAERVAAALRRAGYGRAGINLLINDGPDANQHVPHVHLHLIPRRPGDLPALIWRLLVRFLPRAAAPLVRLAGGASAITGAWLLAS